MLIRGESLLKSILILAWIWSVMGLSEGIAANRRQQVDYARDVRPILADNCFHCHGPDDDGRQASLRLDSWDDMGDIRGAQSVIAVGNPAESELAARIASDDPDLRMPPADSGKSLTSAQVAILQDWIANGAEYEKHWAFFAPRRPPVPEVKNSAWVRNPIDAFVLERLEREGLEPSPLANATTLLRRLSLDLIGLPPSLDEVAAYQAKAGSAYEREIERLLQSPHFGERWGRIWLDNARYADSDGYEKDKPRSVWMYRDWVIDAFNHDMPYDEFLVEQVAGDLLPDSTQDQMVATGFLRNSMLNDEGGADPEQFRMEAMYDRMDAVGKAVLGLTIQCAQCHSHKYDPITQAEYYQMFAFLNNCHEAQITAYTAKQQSEWAATQRLIRAIEDGIRADNPDWQVRMAEWEARVRDNQPEWTVVHPIDEHTSDEKHRILEDDSVLALGFAPTYHWPKYSAQVTLPKITAIRLELLTHPELPRGGPGRSIYGTGALTEFQLHEAQLDKPDQSTELKFARASADVNPPDRDVEKIFDNGSGERRVTGPIERAIDGDLKTAWGIDIGPGRSNVSRKAVFVLEKPLDASRGRKLFFTLGQHHGGANVNDNQTNGLGRYRFAVTSAENPAADPLPESVRAIVNLPQAERTPEQIDHVFSYWRTTVPDWHEENRRIEALWRSHPQGPSQLVLASREDPRTTHRLDRGDYLAPEEAVKPGIPHFLHPLEAPADSESPDRLDFARWLADKRSPTTARSIVNRVWQAYFGTGICATAEDLGTQGEPPSHPELLDWLAVELMERNWSLKHIHRLIVSSSTYRQSSSVTPELLSRDPANRLLARGPRFRVDAEIIRDIALSASGLLHPKIGGPSVYPPAPEFLFQPPASYAEKQWPVDFGLDRYRRGLYTFRFRSVPYPVLQNFDAPIGEVACARRSQSNTPLQALTLLNEPLFLECARELAVKVLTEGGATDTERLNYATHRCLSRNLQPKELAALQSFLERQKLRFRSEDADPWTLAANDKTHQKRLLTRLSADTNPADLAAWTALARVLLSLDETITKE